MKYQVNLVLNITVPIIVESDIDTATATSPTDLADTASRMDHEVVNFSQSQRETELLSAIKKCYGVDTAWIQTGANFMGRTLDSAEAKFKIH